MTKLEKGSTKKQKSDCQNCKHPLDEHYAYNEPWFCHVKDCDCERYI